MVHGFWGLTMSDQTANSPAYFRIDDGTGDLIEVFDAGYTKRWRRLSDGTFAPVVFLEGFTGGGGGGSTSGSTPLDRELVVTSYRCKVAYTGAAVGDIIKKIAVLDVSGVSPLVIFVRWENEQTDLAIAAPPSVAANLERPEISGTSGGITLAEVVGAGLGTAANQVTQIGYLADTVREITGLTALTSINYDANWTDSARATVYTTKFKRRTDGEDLTRTLTIDHVALTQVSVWANSSGAVAAPTDEEVMQASAHILTSHTRRRTSALSRTPQQRTWTFLPSEPTLVHADTGWA